MHEADTHHWCKALVEALVPRSVGEASMRSSLGKAMPGLGRKPGKEKPHHRELHAPEPSPPSSQCSSAPATLYNAPCTHTGREQTVLQAQVAAFTLDRWHTHTHTHALRALRSLRDLPAHMGFPTLSYQAAIKPDQSRGFALDQEGQRYFACLVDLLLLTLVRQLRACYSIAVIYLHSADSTICLESQAGAPRSCLSFAEGLR